MAYFSQHADEVLAALESSTAGLSEEEVRRRRQRYGPNRLTEAPPTPLYVIFLNQFKNFIIYVLLFAICFSLLIGEFVDSIIILAILLLNGSIGFFQELSASRSLDALKKLTRVQASVCRDGSWQTVVADDLVPGDIVALESGARVPADGRLLSAVQLQVEEASLTGESLPVAKLVEPVNEEAQPGDRLNMVFASTAVVAGRGLAVVTATAMETEIGKISSLIRQAGEAMTPLQRRLDRFGRRLGLVIIAVCLVILAVLSVRHLLENGTKSAMVFMDFAFIAISLAVAAVPTALPAVVTISLAVGVKRLLARRCLVRRLASVETLGSCDVICSDKTGTITRNEMTVVYGWSLAGEASLTGSGYEPVGEVSGVHEPLLYEIGLQCNNAVLEEGADGWQVNGNPTEGALLVSAAKAGVNLEGTRLDELPFDSQRKKMSVVVQKGDKKMLYSKGAPDRLLACCTRALETGKVVALSDELRRKVEQANDRYAGRAMRVLAMACKECTGDARDEEDLIFVGLQAMIDPPRSDVAAAIQRAGQAGIRSIMITGDYPRTAASVALAIGIEGQLLTGAELEDLSDKELRQRLLDGCNIFARVVPAHKQRIVRCLQNEGHVVAMTGDGVNDAPALKYADIGIAVGSGTDVAKEASDFVLLDDSFSHIVDAVEEGRGIYDNIQKSIMLLLSGNLGEVLIIFLAVVTGMNLPLTAVLLLWINMITDGAPALAYSVDPYSGEIMRRPPIPVTEGILPRARLLLLGFLGVVGTGLALALFIRSGGATGSGLIVDHGRTMVFNFVVLYEMILVFAIRRHYRIPLFSNPLLWAAVAITLLLQALVLYTPVASFFKVVPPAGADLLALMAASLLFVAAYFGYESVSGALKGRRTG